MAEKKNAKGGHLRCWDSIPCPSRSQPTSQPLRYSFESRQKRASAQGITSLAHPQLKLKMPDETEDVLQAMTHGQTPAMIPTSAHARWLDGEVPRADGSTRNPFSSYLAPTATKAAACFAGKATADGGSALTRAAAIQRARKAVRAFG